MKKVVTYIILLPILCFLFTGCASMSGAGKGALAGSAVGGIIGAAFGGRNGALIGAYAGAMIGAVAGDYHDKKVASRYVAVNRYAYNFREEIIEIEDALIRPRYAACNSTVEAQIQYTVLAPRERQQIRIAETMTLLIGNERLVLAKREVIRTQGTYISAINFTIPKGLPKGDHTLVTTVSNGKQTKSVKTPLKVV